MIIQHLRKLGLRDAENVSDGQLLDCFCMQGEQAAFEALLWRHGAMVLRVCQRVLHNAHDAEDACQATFLVLVRKARSLLGRKTVGNWLHGVAHHTALKARAASCMRREREKQVRTMPQDQPDEVWRELQPFLDQELQRLPEKYRTLIVLCDLEGKTRKEAARLLGLPEGTLSGACPERGPCWPSGCRATALRLPALCWQRLCAGMWLRLACRDRWWFLPFKPLPW